MFCLKHLHLRPLVSSILSVALPPDVVNVLLAASPPRTGRRQCPVCRTSTRHWQCSFCGYFTQDLLFTMSCLQHLNNGQVIGRVLSVAPQPDVCNVLFATPPPRTSRRHFHVCSTSSRSWKCLAYSTSTQDYVGFCPVCSTPTGRRLSSSATVEPT